jgi:hypothetical protein
MFPAILAAAVAAHAALPAKPAAGPSPAIAALFRPDMLDANRIYVERRIGPAKYVAGDVRTYVVAGCTVEITYKGDSVRSLALNNLSNRCTFDLSKFFPSHKSGSAYMLTFGGFATAFGDVKFLPECLGSCGNAADPAMAAYYSGAHAEQFYEVQVSNDYPYRGAAADSAFDVLLNASRNKREADPLYNADCDRAVVSKAAPAFANVQIKGIRIGWDLDPDPARCGQ